MLSTIYMTSQGGLEGFEGAKTGSVTFTAIQSSANVPIVSIDQIGFMPSFFRIWIPGTFPQDITNAALSAIATSTSRYLIISSEFLVNPTLDPALNTTTALMCAIIGYRTSNNAISTNGNVLSSAINAGAAGRLFYDVSNNQISMCAASTRVLAPITYNWIAVP